MKSPVGSSLGRPDGRELQPGLTLPWGRTSAAPPCPSSTTEDAYTTVLTPSRPTCTTGLAASRPTKTCDLQPRTSQTGGRLPYWQLRRYPYAPSPQPTGRANPSPPTLSSTVPVATTHTARLGVQHWRGRPPIYAATNRQHVKKA